MPQRQRKFAFVQDGENKGTLDDLLSPLWKLTYYTGVCLDWCRPMSPKTSGWLYVRYFTVTLSFFLLFPMGIFHTVQLFSAIKSGKSVHIIITNLTWFAPMPVTIYTYLKFIYSRLDFLQFFHDWKTLDSELITSNYFKLTNQGPSKWKIHTIMYISYTVMALMSIVAVLWFIFKNPQGSFLLSYYPAIREMMTLPMIITYHVTVFIMIWILCLLIDVVPAFVHYQFARYVNSLQQGAVEAFLPSRIPHEEKSILGDRINETEVGSAILDLDGPIRLLWARLENLNAFVTEANNLFGALMVCGQGNSVFMMTVGLYATLYSLNNNLNRPVSFFANLFFLVTVAFRFVSCTLISSQLHQAVHELRNFLTGKVGRSWNRIGDDDRKLLCSLIERLQYDNIVACPLGLYNINPSTLLTVMGLVVSYVIVLLETK